MKINKIILVLFSGFVAVRPLLPQLSQKDTENLNTITFKDGFGKNMKLLLGYRLVNSDSIVTRRFKKECRYTFN